MAKENGGLVRAAMRQSLGRNTGKNRPIFLITLSRK
jgi:hypothetical protein